MKEWGFKYWQKSLWASKNDIADPLREFINKLRLSDFVLVVVSNDLGIWQSNQKTDDRS